MKKSLSPLLFLPLLVLLDCTGGVAPPAGRPGEPARIPTCMVIDDPAPFVNMRALKDENVCREIPTPFYREFGEWARSQGVRGKFSIIPCPGGIAAIDGSTGEFPGHTRAERLAWIRLIKELYLPRWTLTPEVITHWRPWDMKRKKEMAGPILENAWLAAQPLGVQTEYIATAMRMFRNAGLPAGGMTICWSYPAEKNHILGEATLGAGRRVYGLDYVIFFNDTGEGPAVAFDDGKGGRAVTLRPGVGDCYDHTFGKKTAADVRRDAARYISEDGNSGAFVDQIRKGRCLIFYTHMQTLYGNGTKTGFQVFKIAVERLQRHYGPRLQWMTGMEICRHFTG